MHTEVILQHGWGFAGEAWRDWLPSLTEPGLVVRVAQRGYFAGKEHSAVFSQEARQRIIIAHSLGLHLIAPETLAAADTIVCFAGFLEFHGSDPLTAKRSRRVIQAMLSKFDEQPLAVLEQFHKNCWSPSESKIAVSQLPSESINYALLKADLQLLDRCVMDPAALDGKHVLLLHGSADIIVPVAVANDFQASVPHADMFTFAGAGHSMPFTHALTEFVLTHCLLESASTFAGLPTGVPCPLST